MGETTGQPAPRDIQLAVRELVKREGTVAAAAKVLGLARQSVANLVAGLPVLPGTIAQARERLAAR